MTLTARLRVLAGRSRLEDRDLGVELYEALIKKR